MESPASVVVVAHWVTTEADLDTVLEHVTALGRLSLAEPGCVGYQVFQRAEEPTSFVVIEHYRDADAQQAHANSLHYQEHVCYAFAPC